MQDRDQFELTKYLTPAQFKKGNQFDDEWFDRISRYMRKTSGSVSVNICNLKKTVKGRLRDLMPPIGNFRLILVENSTLLYISLKTTWILIFHFSDLYLFDLQTE